MERTDQNKAGKDGNIAWKCKTREKRRKRKKKRDGCTYLPIDGEIKKFTRHNPTWTASWRRTICLATLDPQVLSFLEWFNSRPWSVDERKAVGAAKRAEVIQLTGGRDTGGWSLALEDGQGQRDKSDDQLW